MIGFLSGKIKLIGEDFIILQTDGGVGYTVFCLGTFLAKISLIRPTFDLALWMGQVPLCPT